MTIQAMCEQFIEQMKRINERMEGQMDKIYNEWIDKNYNEWMNKNYNEWMDKNYNEWMNKNNIEWMDKKVKLSI